MCGPITETVSIPKGITEVSVPYDIAVALRNALAASKRLRPKASLFELVDRGGEVLVEERETGSVLFSFGPDGLDLWPGANAGTLDIPFTANGTIMLARNSAPTETVA